MRILMITDVYFPRINGVSTSIKTFNEDLAKLGHEIHLIAPCYSDDDQLEKNVIRINAKPIPFDPEDRRMNYREILSLADALAQLEFDLIHIQTPFIAHYAGTRLAKKLNVPCIATYHTLFEEYFFHYIPWLPSRLLRFVARKFSASQCNSLDGVISPSQVIADLLSTYGVRRTVAVIPTGIDISKFQQGCAEQFLGQLDLPPQTKVLLNVSRVAFEKNIDTLIKVFAKLRSQRRDVHLVIAGEGPARDHLIRQASMLGLTDSISFVGYLDRSSDLVSCYKAADLFIFASRTETQGLVLLEAMAAGTPVVSVAEMGTASVLIDGQGARITDGSIDDFCTKISNTLEDKKGYQNLCQSALTYAETWNSESLALKMADYYSEILAGSLVVNQSSAEQSQ